jgi:predicted Zn-dependent protease
VTRHPARRVIVALVVAAVLLADLGAGLWHAPGAMAQSAAPYHWARKQSHFRLRIGDDVDGDWNAYLRAALDDWNQNEAVTLIEVDGSTNPQNCDPVSGTVQICDWMYGTQTGWLGLTRLYFNNRGDHIDAATVQLNDSFMYAPNSPYNSDAARRHTICHELGHTLGLDHVATTSCMNNSQEAVFNNVAPLNDDFRELRQIYAHEDATRTVAQVAETDLDLFDSPLWPEADSEEDVMALPLDEETSVLTFVTWADETVLAAGTAVAALNGDPGLAPATADRDGDGVADEDELALYYTDPALADSDGDGALDGEELFARHTDPLLWDDGSSATGDPVSDASAPVIETTATTKTDLDVDNYPDAAELTVGLDPANPDTDGDGVADGDEGALYGTNPLSADTDGDGLTDGEELFAAGSDPLRWDTDGDGASDAGTTPG